MVRPDFSAVTVLAWVGSLPGQLSGLALVLAPGVVHPLPMDGGLRVAVQLVAVVAGTLGVIIVAAGLLTRVVPGDQPAEREVQPVRVQLVELPRPRACWSAGMVLALALAAGAAACGIKALDDDRYLAATVMFGLPALALGWLLWWTRAQPPAPGA